MKSIKEKSTQRDIERILRQKDKLVARRLRIEVENRIIERKMNTLSNELNALINTLLETPPTMNMEEIRVAQINRFHAIQMVRDRYPDLGMQDAKALVDQSMEASRREDGEERQS